MLLVASNLNGALAEIFGVGLRNSTDLDGYTKGSMMGGAELFIYGDHFNEEAGSNQVIATIDGQEIGYPELSIADTYNSRPSEARLAVTTESVLTLYNAAWDDFDGSTSLPHGGEHEPFTFDFAVENTGTATVAYSSGSPVIYERNYTPLI